MEHACNLDEASKPNAQDEARTKKRARRVIKSPLPWLHPVEDPRELFDYDEMYVAIASPDRFVPPSRLRVEFGYNDTVNFV